MFEQMCYYSYIHFLKFPSNASSGKLELLNKYHYNIIFPTLTMLITIILDLIFVIFTWWQWWLDLNFKT